MPKGSANYNGVETPKYDTLHKRLLKNRGRASLHMCEECGSRQATAWSYDHKDSDSLTEAEGKYAGVTYSIKLEHYRPLCRSCHALLDFSVTESRNKATLTAEQVRYVKERLAQDTYRGILTELAQELGVHICTISAIRHERNWAWV